MVNQYIWIGKSGRKYRYGIYSMETQFVKKPGNYIFAKRAGAVWLPCYIGQTESLGDRLADHEKETCAKRHGATHIHAHTTDGGELVRKAEEKDLIARWNPPCNEQLG